MRASLYLAPVLVAVNSVVAQHVHLQIPEVERYVSDMLSKFNHYTHYSGPSAGVSTVANPTATITVISPTETVSVGKVAVAVAAVATSSCDYWMEDISHQGIAAFNSAPGTYQVFRNVKDFGAKGDGVTDDTAAINSAISSGGRCAPGTCGSSTTTPAVVYFPAGVYMISASIIDYYYTQLIGNANCLPTIRALPAFSGGLGMIDADPYQSSGNLGFGATNVFWRQIRNMIIDMTLVPASSAITGIHWPTAQATSIQNVIFQMSSNAGTQHQGIFIESGSAGFMNDLIFYGGLQAINVGNQQYTMRNLTFYNAVTAINQIWDWGWTYTGINIVNCSVGLQMSNGGSTDQSVGSVTFIDSSITNTPVFVVTARTSSSSPAAAGSLILENVALSNVPIAVQLVGGTTLLAGTPTNTLISAWGQGHSYTPTGPNVFAGSITPVARPASLLSGTNYYARSKPQYQTLSYTNFVSARTAGAKGDGKTDDTVALQAAITSAASKGYVLYLDHGDYLVTSTIYIPAGSRIVGESYSVILSSGAYFNSMTDPKPVLQIGKSGEAGTVELSDFIVSTQGQQMGAVLFEWNLASASSTPSGMWDVHTRVGGFAGSNLQLAQCPTTPSVVVTSSNLVQKCIAAFMTMHITKSASGIYMENTWFWVADHDVDDPNLTQLTIYAGRGLLDESTTGNVWMVGTAIEHHTLYEYQFVNTLNVFAGQVQTETAYYQPNPSAPLPFPYNASLFDPQFPSATVTINGTSVPAADGWGLRIVSSSQISIYGVGLYSFFNDYSTTCSDQGGAEECQNHNLDIESSSAVTIYNLNTVGSHYMFTLNGVDQALFSDNADGFVDTVALIKVASAGTAASSTAVASTFSTSTVKASTASVATTSASTVKTTTTAVAATSTSAAKTSTTASVAKTTSVTSTASAATASSTAPTCPGSSGATYVSAGKTFQIECNIDHTGGDMQAAVTVSSLKQCIDTCASTTGCVDVSLSGTACYLKNTLGASTTSTGLSGAKLISSSSTTVASTSTTSKAATTVAASTSTSVKATTATTTKASTTTSASSSTSAPVCPGSAGASYVSNGVTFTIECNTDHAAGDMQAAVQVSSLKACLDLCATTTGCVDVSLSGTACYLKNTVGASSTVAGLSGGKKVS